MHTKKVELLAPAGNMEGFLGAIHAGADAVYLGGDRFGARAYADNFTGEELIEAIRYAHLWGRRVYLTVNTLVKEGEFSTLYEYMAPLYEAGLDGVIVQDMGVLSYLHHSFPEMELHASTQLTLTDWYGARHLKDLGVCRVVPARELSLSELTRLKEATGLELEVFIHGAMCYCYSGQCLFSSLLGGRSGNRGRCAQPCRLPYKVSMNQKNSKECYPLSLKDLCTIEHLPQLIRAGIDSFKIEGRMKKPEYAAGVTALYRKYIDQYYEGTWNGVAKEDLDSLSKLYIRSDRQDGYYHRHNGKEMVALENPAYQGTDEHLLSEIRSKYLSGKQTLSISMEASFLTGEKAALTLRCREEMITVEGEPVEAATRQPITEENIKKQLGKLGDSSFRLQGLEIASSGDGFYPLGAINELRRRAVTLLEDRIITAKGFAAHRTLADPVEHETVVRADQDVFPCVYSVRTLEQLAVLTLSGELGQEPMRIYLNGDLLVDEKGQTRNELATIKSMCETFRNSHSEITYAIALPPILRQREEAYLEGIYRLLCQEENWLSGLQVKSLDGAGYGIYLREKADFPIPLYADASLYAWNIATIDHWREHLQSVCLPYELKAGEQRALIGTMPCEKIIYGRIPMMITANCVVNTLYGCKKRGDESVYLIDRYQKQFPVERSCQHCTNIIYNSVPLSLHADADKWKNRAALRMDFTIESGKETLSILRFFMGKEKIPYKEYTTGHEKRGVE